MKDQLALGGMPQYMSPCETWTFRLQLSLRVILGGMVFPVILKQHYCDEPYFEGRLCSALTP